jgi:hypothetical protein
MQRRCSGLAVSLVKTVQMFQSAATLGSVSRCSSLERLYQGRPEAAFTACDVQWSGGKGCFGPWCVQLRGACASASSCIVDNDMFSFGRVSLGEEPEVVVQSDSFHRVLFNRVRCFLRGKATVEGASDSCFACCYRRTASSSPSLSPSSSSSSQSRSFSIAWACRCTSARPLSSLTYSLSSSARLRKSHPSDL